MKFKVVKIGQNPSAVALVSYQQSMRKKFPAPQKSFKLLVDEKEYITSIRNLKSGCTSLGKTYDASGRRITRADFCFIHDLQEGLTLCIEVVSPFWIYRLTKSVKQPKSESPRKGNFTEEPTGLKGSISNRMTLQQFAAQIDYWYQRYTESDHFQRYKNIEAGLTQKASDVGYLEPRDLLDIAIWGGDEERHQLGTRICNNNTYENVVHNTRDAIKKLNTPGAALKSMMRITYVGPSYGSKALRCVCPEKHAAFDTHVRKVLKSMLPEMTDRESEVIGYVGFLEICSRLRELVNVPGPRQGDLWYIADIEMALFQFAREGGIIS